MNISDWPLSSIMQLPDYLFGRRFLVSAQVTLSGQSSAWDISEVPFPENIVIWELSSYSSVSNFARIQCRIALGDQLPANAAQMAALEPLFNGFGATGIGPREINHKYIQNFCMRRLKMGVRTAGRRLCIECVNTSEYAATYTVLLTVSSVPKDIPSWFGSDNRKRSS